MSVRTFTFVPDRYDPDYYGRLYSEPDYDDDDRWEAFMEDRISELDRALDTARELYWMVTDDDTGEAPAFMKVSIEREEPYPYGAFPDGAVVVTCEIMDDLREIDDAWATRQGEDIWTNSPSPLSRHRHQALSRYNREMSKADRMFDALVEYGFTERGPTGRVTAMEAWGDDPYHTTDVPSPYEWPSRSVRSKGRGKAKTGRKVKAAKSKSSKPTSPSVKPKKSGKTLQRRDAKGRFVSLSVKPRKYFDEVRDRAINVHGKPGVSTQQTPTGFNRDTIEPVTGNLNVAASRKTPQNPKTRSSNGAGKKKGDPKKRSASNKPKGARR